MLPSVTTQSYPVLWCIVMCWGVDRRRVYLHVSRVFIFNTYSGRSGQFQENPKDKRGIRLSFHCFIGLHMSDLIWALRLTLCPMVDEFICQNYIELHHGMHVIKALTCLFELREGLLTLSFQCSATALGGLRLLRPILSHSCKLLDPKGPSTNRCGCETALMILI